jgi:hypothetical protein
MKTSANLARASERAKRPPNKAFTPLRANDLSVSDKGRNVPPGQQLSQRSEGRIDPRVPSSWRRPLVRGILRSP